MSIYFEIKRKIRVFDLINSIRFVDIYEINGIIYIV